MRQPQISDENPKTKYFRIRKQLVDQLIQNQSLYQASIKYLSSFGSWQAVNESKDGLANFLPELLLHTMLEKHDKAGLCWLLSMFPIDLTGPDGWYIEYALVSSYRNQSMLNILILFDAYKQSNDSTVRSCLMQSIRRAFHDRIKPTDSDADVLKNTPVDFTSRQGSLKVNQYWRYAYSPGFWDSNVIAPPLFISIDGPDEVKETIIE